jgi:hypothetical protein
MLKKHITIGITTIILSCLSRVEKKNKRIMILSKGFDKDFFKERALSEQPSRSDVAKKVSLTM